MKRSMKTWVALVALCWLLFLFPLVGSAEPREIVKFEPGDTLAEIREKIEHNAYNFTVDHNWVYDMSPEARENFLTRRFPLFPKTAALLEDIGPLAPHLGKQLPAQFDWRDYNGHSYIGPIRDQGSCGSCYAFAACATAEGTYNWAKGNYDENCADFSESFIIWCLGRLDAYALHFYGCEGADYDYYELEALTAEGLCSEADFPYTTSDPGSCTHWEDQATVFTSWHRIDCSDIEAIKTAIMTYGVVDAAVWVGGAFSAYSGGIYEDANTSCSSTPCYYTPTNHAIALVGWNDNGDPENNGYWILRNSWGTEWGEEGYMRIKYTSAFVACEACYLVPQSPAATISGAPSSPTTQTDATLTVGGEGVTLYKYKLDEGGYSSETPISTPITITDLDDGAHSVSVLGRDNAGNWQSEGEPTIVSWVVDTVAPIADAGPDQTVDEGGTVSLNGANSSDNGSGIASYLWEQTEGTSVTLSDSTEAQPMFTSPDVGPGGASLTFRLTVSDNAGWESTDTCIINVGWLNVAPTADAGDDQEAEEGDTVTLDGSGSTDPDDGIASYLWEQTEGTSVTLSNAALPKPTFTAPNVDEDGASFTFRLTVADDGGKQATDTCIVNVTGDNDPPAADAGADQTVDEAMTVTLDGSDSSDPDDGIHRYLWSQTVGTPVTLSDTSAVQPTFVTPPVDSNGTRLVFGLTITDNGGLEHSDTVRIDIEDNGITGFPADVLPATSPTGKNIGIKVESGGSITSFMMIAASSLPESSDMPENCIYGLIDMQAKPDTAGGMVKVSVYLGSPAPSGYTWFKYGPNKGWYDFSKYAAFNDTRDQVMLTLTDGGAGDDDGAANGVIVDPSGLAVPSNTDGDSSDGGCFIAAVASGSPMAGKAGLRDIHGQVE